MTFSKAWANIPPPPHTHTTTHRWDIIFIDGLHTYEQAFRDFTDSIALSHQNTLWIMDDTLPSDAISSVVPQDKSYKIRKLAGLRGYPWHGDVFKSVFMIHDFYPDFSYATVVNNGNPQTVLWKTGTPATRKRLFANYRDIERMNYFDMLDKLHHMNPVLETNLDGQLGTHFEVHNTDAEKWWPFVICRIGSGN